MSRWRRAAWVLVSAVIGTASAVETNASGAPESYGISTYAGPNLAEGVQALSTNVRALSIASLADGSLLVGVSTDRGFVRLMSPSGELSTLAGQSVRDLAENHGGSALDADLIDVLGMAVDSAGQVYLAAGLYVVRRLDSDGRIYTVAGTWGERGFSGDGGLATGAHIGWAKRIAIAPDGSVVFSEDARVRRIRPDGIIETVAGTGSTDKALVADGEPAVESVVRGPWGLAYDSIGRLHIADVSDGRIRRVELDGTLATVAGNGSVGDHDGDGGLATDARIGSPTDVVFDEAGNFYISDKRNGVIRKIDTSGIITTIAGTGVKGYAGDGGPAVEAQLAAVEDLDFDADGSLLVVDFENNRVRKITADGTIRTIAGNGEALFGGDGLGLDEACFSSPADVVFADNGVAFIADRGNKRIRMVDANGVVSTIAGIGEDGSDGNGGPAIDARLTPVDLELAPNGDLYFVDLPRFGGGRVRRIDSGGLIHLVAGTGATGYNGDGRPATTASISRFTGITIDQSGTLYIADSGNSRIRYVDADGLIQTLAGTGDRASTGDGGQASLASVLEPESMCTSEQGELYFSETASDKVRKIDTDGIITTVVGTGTRGYSGDGGLAIEAELSVPFGVAVDSLGYLYISDGGNKVVRRVSPNGLIETIAGTGGSLYLGEGLPALEADIWTPTNITLGADKELFVSTLFAGRLYRLTPHSVTPITWAELSAALTLTREVELSWTSNSSRIVDYEVFRQGRGFWERLALVPGTGVGRVTYREPVPEGLDFAFYRIDVREEGRLVGELGPIEVRYDRAPSRQDVELRASPNPFNPRITFEYSIPVRGESLLRIFDQKGRLVRLLIRESGQGGFRRDWDGRADNGAEVASGVYYAELRLDGVVTSRLKITLVR